MTDAFFVEETTFTLAFLVLLTVICLISQSEITDNGNTECSAEEVNRGAKKASAVLAAVGLPLVLLLYVTLLFLAQLYFQTVVKIYLLAQNDAALGLPCCNLFYSPARLNDTCRSSRALPRCRAPGSGYPRTSWPSKRPRPPPPPTVSVAVFLGGNKQRRV